MFRKATPVLAALVGLGLTLSAVPTAEGQTLRERLRERREQRQEQRQEAQEQGGEAQQGGQARAGRGAQSVTIVHDGRERSFLVHVPPTLSDRPGAVLLFHGGGGGAERFYQSDTMRDAADQGGFLAVYPDAGGRGERWNDGRASTAGGADDVGFVRAIVAYLQEAYGLDPSRVFAAGISNGGMFAHRLACDAPDVVAGIAPVAANMPRSLVARCSPGSGTPVVMFSGTADPLMPFEGGVPQRSAAIERAAGPATDEMLSAPDTARFWADVNGCGGERSADLQDSSDDGTTVTEIDFTDCDGGQVILLRINGGGHSWPGSTGRERRLAGATSRDIDASATMARFFSQYGL